jgi:hypothetical protein
MKKIVLCPQGFQYTEGHKEIVLESDTYTLITNNPKLVSPKYPTIHLSEQFAGNAELILGPWHANVVVLNRGNCPILTTPKAEESISFAPFSLGSDALVQYGKVAVFYIPCFTRASKPTLCVLRITANDQFDTRITMEI